jgi:hypothetical protein
MMRAVCDIPISVWRHSWTGIAETSAKNQRPAEKIIFQNCIALSALSVY